MEEWPREKLKNELKETSPKKWSDEGFDLTKETVYEGIVENEEVSDDYK